ncbi:MAG TPA: B12-binding domain-containing radical SAM protein [Nanoarchaeota archaeon]|nr:B12-binding domain-containing radical SAM protein [Nanoarchaeota archaeon]
MKVQFVYNGAENLGIECLSSFLKSNGHVTALLFDPAIFSGDQLINNKWLSRICSIDDLIVKRIADEKPDIIAFSCFTGNYRWCLSIAEKIKRVSQIPIIFGGVHVTAVPSEVLSNACVDYIVIGEGEYALLELVQYLENGKEKKLSEISNLGYKQDGKLYLNNVRAYIKDLDSLPFPDKELFYNKVSLFAEHYYIMTSRGCPFNCTYCSNNLYHSTYASEKNQLRRRSPDNVIDELKIAKLMWHPKLIKFADDVFSSSKEWLQKFIPLYKSEINIPFFCSVHPNTMTPEIAKLLKEGGCWFVTMGVQSGSERIRKEVFHRFGTNEQIVKAIACIKDAGMTISVDNIFGAPSETEVDLKSSLELYCRTKPDRILTFWLTYYPGTEIIKIALDKNELSQEDINNANKGFIGFTHESGSVNKDKKKMYQKYAVLFQLRSLVKNNQVYCFIANFLSYMPFKDILVKLVILLNGFKNNDVMVFNAIKYICAKKKIP